MQRVSALLPTWDRSRPTSPKTAFFRWGSVSTARTSSVDSTSVKSPVRFEREHYWPTNLDRECEKAARILQSFCYDGYISQDEPVEAGPSTAIAPAQDKKRIPPAIIQNAVGLAIFSCMRSGLWMSGSGGSGILIARKSDGSWSPPSGFLLHTAALAFVIGVDIYDCVLVINSVADLEMFTRPRVILGSDVQLAVGPVVSTGEPNTVAYSQSLDNTVLTYLKAKGQHRAVNIDGAMVTERSNENERFYESDASVLDILAGEVRKEIPETRPLYEVIKAAEGRVDFDANTLVQLGKQPAPGDASIQAPSLSPTSPSAPTFGVPNTDDPDPYGVIALEMAGLEIREAGALDRPMGRRQTEFAISPLSAAFNLSHRGSLDAYVSHSQRESCESGKTSLSRMTDAHTQTGTVETGGTTPISRRSLGSPEVKATTTPTVVKEPEEVDYMQVDMSAVQHFKTPFLDEESVNRTQRMTKDQTSLLQVPAIETPGNIDYPVSDRSQDADDEGDDDKAETAKVGDEAEHHDEDTSDGEDDLGDDEEEPVIFEVATASKPQRTAMVASQATKMLHAKGALVTIGKRTPPPLPTRSPARHSGSRFSNSDLEEPEIPARSSRRQSFRMSGLSQIMLPGSRPASLILAKAISTPLPMDDDEDENSARPVSYMLHSAADEDVRDTVSEPRYSIDPFAPGHQRASSSVYTAIIEDAKSGSATEEVPTTPTAWQMSDTVSSVGEDTENEPTTPRPDETFQIPSLSKDLLPSPEPTLNENHSLPIGMAMTL